MNKWKSKSQILKTKAYRSRQYKLMRMAIRFQDVCVLILNLKPYGICVFIHCLFTAKKKKKKIITVKVGENGERTIVAGS